MTEWLLIFVFLMDPRTPALAHMAVRSEEACKQKISEMATSGITIIAHNCVFMPDQMGSV